MKRIVICADGTWNDRDQVDKKSGKRKPTNVTKVARAVLPKASGINQIVYYHDGIGTGGAVDKFTGGAFGKGMAENIANLYRFIVYNYEKDDQLYFFGFSRGAFTVRSLVGFMHKFGLIEKDDDYYVPEIYSCYENDKCPEDPEWKHAFHNVKETRPCPPIKFIGVWDTVGALGAPGFLGHFFNRKKYQYHNTDLNSAVENAVQAISIDERRKPFKPDIWVKPDNWSGNLAQAWFPGVHSNVGGGYDPDGLANEALHWVVEHAENCDLGIDSNYLSHYLPCFNSDLRDSMSWKYRVMGPNVRVLGANSAGCEAIHQSAVDRMNLKSLSYEPENLQECLSKSKLDTVNTTRISRGKPCPPIEIEN